jgi:hypothetical protein
VLPPAILAPGEHFATVEDIRDVPDRATMPVEVPQWRHPDGTPFKILLRAPSFREATEIDQAARTAEGEDDDAAFVLETCLRVIVEPKFTRAQLEILRDKNPDALDAICDTGWRLTRISARALEAEVRRLADIPAPPKRSRARRAPKAGAAAQPTE